MIFFFIFLIFFIFKVYNLIEDDLVQNGFIISKADITEPRFAINNPSQRIFVTAKEGNFIEEGKILLKKNVKFTSNNFSIESDNVTFDRKKQTAQSNNESIFKSENTTISSEGFDIFDNGNKINFYNNSIIILK